MLTYSNVSPSQIEEMKTKLTADGHTTITEVAPGSFRISGHGVSVGAIYHADTQALTVEAAWLIRGAVDKGIKEALGRD